MKFQTLVLLVFCGLWVVLQSVGAESSEHTNCLAIVEQSEAGPEKAQRSKKDSFEHSYAVAECLRKAAASAGAEWLKTGQLLEQSSEEAENGHWDVATGLANRARFQAETALQQAEYEAQAWKRRVVGKR